MKFLGNRTTGRALLVACVSLLLLSAARAQSVVASQSEIKNFLGGQGGRLFFIDNADGGKLKHLDLDDSALQVKMLDDEACRDPRISADGTRVAYGVDDKIYARKISGGDRVLVATVGTAKSKGVGYWYASGSTEYLIYCTSTDKYGYTSGVTYKQKVKNGVDPDGEPEQIYNKAYDGGITPDGKWIGEAYGDRHAYNLDTSKEYVDFYKADDSTEGQCCNGSMAPMTGPYRMVTLVLPHDYFRSWQYDSGQDRWQEYKTYTKPSGTEEWQTPEWSLHQDYITVTAKDGGYDLYIQNANDPSKRIKVIDGDIGTSHLYVGATTTPPGCFGPGDCDDGNPCTTDSCDVGACQHAPVSGCCTDDAQCDDGGDCTTDSCGADNVCQFQPLAGCCQVDDDCVDTNPCTADRCTVATGECDSTTITGCCAVDTDCDDGDVCTIDRCDVASNSCSNPPLVGCGTGQQPATDAGAGRDAGPAVESPAEHTLSGGCSINRPRAFPAIPALMLTMLLVLVLVRRR